MTAAGVPATDDSGRGDERARWAAIDAQYVDAKYGANGIGGSPAPARDHETSQPTGLGDKEGDEDGKQGGVHPDRTRQAAEGSDRRGIHGGSGVLDRPGSDPEGRVPDVAGRELTNSAPDGTHVLSGATPTRPGTAELREEIARGIWEATNGEGSHLSWEDDRVSDLYRNRYRDYADVVLATDGVQRLLAVEQRVERLAEAIDRAAIAADMYGFADSATDHRSIARKLRRALGGGDDA